MLKEKLLNLIGKGKIMLFKTPEEEILAELIREATPEARRYDNRMEVSKTETFQKIKEMPHQGQLKVLFVAVKALLVTHPHGAKYGHFQVYQQLIQSFLKSAFHIPFYTLLDLIALLDNSDVEMIGLHVHKAFLNRLSLVLNEDRWDEEVEKTLECLKVEFVHDYYQLRAPERNFNQQINQLIGRYSKTLFLLDNDGLGEFVKNYLQPFAEKQEAWKQLIFHFTKPINSSKPTKQWWKTTQKYLEPIGEKTVTDALTAWLKQAVEVYKSFATSLGMREKSERNEYFIRAIIWTAGHLNHPPLTEVVESLGLICYKKISGYGQCSTRLGNACLHTFAMLPYQEGIVRLTYYRSKVKYPSTRRLIERRILEVADREGKTKDEIEEMGIPSLGLDRDHRIEQPMEDYTGILEIEGLQQIKLYWKKPDGKTQKSAPAKFKTSHKTSIAGLKNTAKILKQALPAQRDRIERFFLAQRAWNYADWFPLYIDHPLVGYLGKRLIWFFEKGDQRATAIFFNQKWVDRTGQTINWIDKNTSVQLWHPIGFPPDYIGQWRDWLLKNQIQQPLKQAYREVYILTDAEVNTQYYSNRFAAHIIRQHQFNALCQLRGWHYTLQGNWDSHNIPYRNLPQWDIKVHFLVNADHNGATSGSGIFEYVFTDQVQFYNADGRMDLQEVPALVFSELMRDVDLFVGVGSIGNDPEWQDRGNEQYRNYWRDYSIQSLSENSKTRKAILEQLIPRLKIADQCTFTDKQLVVNGKLRTYYIHLGSSNIQMSPNNQYLCIVPGSQRDRSGQIFLPFEGDRLLSIILSKAFLLAEDDKISDPTIVSQIRR
ncbi:MAG: hypothetical protein DHS20C18_09430 [Saprospiraceae bacterium]|nr:MAG: hypothetical protein DHS20C18_09430 [Saprospiraceae bacterium]